MKLYIGDSTLPSGDHPKVDRSLQHVATGMRNRATVDVWATTTRAVHLWLYLGGSNLNDRYHGDSDEIFKNSVERRDWLTFVSFFFSVCHMFFDGTNHHLLSLFQIIIYFATSNKTLSLFQIMNSQIIIYSIYATYRCDTRQARLLDMGRHHTIVPWKPKKDS